MASKLFKKKLEEIPNYTLIFASKSLDIVEQINWICESKGWTQKKLAEKLGKRESEISKWLSGGHNITLKTIAKLEDVLGEEILVTPNRVTDRLDLNNFKKSSIRKRDSFCYINQSHGSRR